VVINVTVADAASPPCVVPRPGGGRPGRLVERRDDGQDVLPIGQQREQESADRRQPRVRLAGH
jgi:hypothetical protein